MQNLSKLKKTTAKFSLSKNKGSKMGIVRQDFTVVYEIAKIGSIKGWKESEMDGNKNNPFQKIRAVIVEEKEDKDIGIRDIETIIDFKIETESKEQARDLNFMLRTAKKNNVSLKIRGNLPKKIESVDDILTVKSIIPYDQFLKQNPDLKSDLKEK